MQCTVNMYACDAAPCFFLGRYLLGLVFLRLRLLCSFGHVL